MSERRTWTATLAALVLGAVVAGACGGDNGGTSATSTTTRAAVPAVVQVVTARAAGGSGEVSVRWNAVATVTGYRVLRANAATGPFSVSADIDITTGKTSAGADVINIWSQQRSYVPSGAAAAGPDSSPWFEYVELVSGEVLQRYFRVVAYNADGEAPASVVVCGAPTGRPSC